jgi:C-terminal processing protease CtpA/Prc
MKVILAIIMFFCCGPLFCQAQTDYSTLSKACELWGLIKYFNPQKPGNQFDSAFAANVPAMMVAKGEMEWKNILARWLSVLNDSATKIMADQSEEPVDGGFDIHWSPDSILVVKISGLQPLQDYIMASDFGKKLKKQLPLARAIIFDIRQPVRIPAEYYGTFRDLFLDVNADLATEFVPQFSTVYYSGFKAERRTNTGYSTNNVVQNLVEPGQFDKRDQKAIWIVNKYSELPPVALSQQAAGKALILSDSEDALNLVPLSTLFSLSSTFSVKFRTADLITAHGVESVMTTKYPSAEDPLRISKNLLSSWTEIKQTPKIIKVTSTQAKAISYPSGTYPSVGYRILAAAKIFTVIENFFPYTQFMDRNWKSILLESLPDFANAKDEYEYGLAVAKMYANIRDSHGFAIGNKGLEQLTGQSPSPVSVDWIENKIVVTRLRDDSVCNAEGIHVGDVVLKINQISVNELMRKFYIYYSYSSKQDIQQRAAQYCIRGPENQQGLFTIKDQHGKIRDVKLKWTREYNKKFVIKPKLDTLVLLSDNIGYADLTRMERNQTDKMFEKFKHTKAIIFDMRGYPKGTAWSIAPRLTENKNVAVALFRRPEVFSPNIPSNEILTSRSYKEYVQTVASSDKWKYKGKTVMLINQSTISQAEHTGLFFKSVNNTIFIGSPTSGADGGVTDFDIPGGMSLNFSSVGVWHADGRQLQRQGLQPDMRIYPTIKGIREGKDEVLDKAIKWIGKNLK